MQEELTADTIELVHAIPVKTPEGHPTGEIKKFSSSEIAALLP